MVSILINTYNDKPEWLRKTINSYLANKIEKQIIVCCLITDTNLEWLKTVRDIELCILSEKKHPGKGAMGIYYQINAAIKRVKGEWFCLMSGNDYVAPDRLKKEVELCEKTGKKVCYSDFYEVNELGNIIKKREFFQYDYEKHLTLGNFVSDAALVSTKLLKKYAPFKAKEFGNYAHYDFWLRIYEGEGDVFIYNPEPLWYYLQNNDASHRNRTAEQVAELKILREKMLCRK